MRWNIIGWLQILGLAYSWAAAKGWASGPEWAWWLGLTLVGGWVIARWTPSNHFMHGLWAGLIMAILSTVVQWWLKTGAASWTWSETWSWMIPVMWLALAVWMGAMAWLIDKVVRRPIAATA